ncbi:hypothetical protein D3C85_1588060 [compost metagenome]
MQHGSPSFSELLHHISLPFRVIIEGFITGFLIPDAGNLLIFPLYLYVFSTGLVGFRYD